MAIEQAVHRIWRDVAVSALSVVLTLLGAWATHSVSQDDLSNSINNERQMRSAQLDNINTQIVLLRADIAKIEIKLDAMQADRLIQGKK